MIATDLSQLKVLLPWIQSHSKNPYDCSINLNLGEGLFKRQEEFPWLQSNLDYTHLNSLPT